MFPRYRDKSHAVLVLCDVLYLHVLFTVSCSLTLHPDNVRVASGQTSGVDKDGKVTPLFRVFTEMTCMY